MFQFKRLDCFNNNKITMNIICRVNMTSYDLAATEKKKKNNKKKNDNAKIKEPSGDALERFSYLPLSLGA